jgi:hypothetical protein
MTITDKIKKLVLLLGLTAVTSVAAQSSTATGPNNVYIEQVGSSNTITVEQVGGTNNIGGVDNTAPSSTNYATITGNTNTVIVTQTGDNNLGQYNIRGNDNVYTSTITGQNNSSKLVVGDQDNPNNLRNTVTETVTGDNNIVVQTLIGNDITSTLAITGNTNQVNKELKSTNGVSNIAVLGNNNNIDAQQIDAAGGVGHNLQQTVTGDFNSIVTQQQGTNDTTVNIQTTGNHNTVTVRSSSGSIVGPLTAVAR